MGTRGLGVGLAAVYLTSAFSVPASAQSKIIPAPTAPVYNSVQRITIIGTVKRMGAGPRPTVFSGDDGHIYSLDTSHANVTMTDGESALTPGSRVYISGRLVDSRDIVVSRLQVIPVAIPVPPPVPASVEPLDYTVRGTVEAVDYEHGSFVLRIKTHSRIVFVTADTDVSGLGPADAGLFPVQPGRRVTVGGSLQPDGTVLAGLLTSKGDVNFQAAPTQANRVLIGTVSSTANKLGRRDIKVRMADGTETKIQIPRDIPIRRSGRQISVFDLNSRDTIRITGRMSDSAFRAFRIDVLASIAADVPAATPVAPPARPGL